MFESLEIIIFGFDCKLMFEIKEKHLTNVKGDQQKHQAFRLLNINP